MVNIFKKITSMGLEEENEKTGNETQMAPEEEMLEETEKEMPITAPDETDNEEKWLDDDYEEGQLSIDVYQTSDSIVVKSTIAGVSPDDIDISINNDMLTIRGRRSQRDEIREENYLYRECYWGSFSRSIILPVEIEAEKIEATLENGILTVVLPKAKVAKSISIKVKEK